MLSTPLASTCRALLRETLGYRNAPCQSGARRTWLGSAPASRRTCNAMATPSLLGATEAKYVQRATLWGSRTPARSSRFLKAPHGAMESPSPLPRAHQSPHLPREGWSRDPRGLAARRSEAESTRRRRPHLGQLAGSATAGQLGLHRHELPLHKGSAQTSSRLVIAAWAVEPCNTHIVLRAPPSPPR
jgi:hypothetical protein